MATHSSILAWKIPWIEEPGVAKNWMRLSTHTRTYTTLNTDVFKCTTQ